MRRPLAPIALSLLLSLALVVPTIAADPAASAGASPEPTAVPSADPTPSEDPGASADPTPSEDPGANTDPTPSADPAQSPAPIETTDPAPADDPATPDPSLASPARRASATDPATDPATDLQGRPIATGRYIVLLSPTADTAGVINRHGRQDGVKADRRFERAVHAFTAKLDAGQRKALQADPSVLAVVPDEVVSLEGQVNPTGISRIGARLSPAAKIDTIDERVDTDVAIVDTGVYPQHPDLNVSGGVNCSTSDRTAWQDENGHGTHVAGTVGAIDNDFGVVGVAPGARIWAVRILNKDGYGLLSWYVCGLDWILGQRDPNDASRPLIEAVNMSVAKTGSDDGNCGITNKDVLHQAICRLYKAGITVVAAAANNHTSAAKYVPAAYNEVITVSALADTDGKAGGLGGNRCYSWGTYDVDDTFADFSNYGSDVDIIAPGKCIYSTVPTGYGTSSGTSMAAPAVTGAAALYKASRPLATPSEVRESLRYLGNFGWKTSTDPDSVHEPLLDVHRVDALGSFSVSSAGGATVAAAAGGSTTFPITINRGATFFERVRLAFTNLPSGWTASFAAPSLYGWTANSTTMTIGVPLTAALGDYQFNVVGTNWGRTSTSTVTVHVDATPFTDLAAFPVQITWLYSQGITGGCAATLFCPKSNVSRVQMAMFLDRALNLPAATVDYFDDDDGKTGEASINSLAQAGITGGCAARRFCPGSSVSRAQMAMFLDRALHLVNATTDYFDDDDGITGETSINALALSGITGGCGTRRYCPTASVTREQMAAFLYRALGN